MRDETESHVTRRRALMMTAGCGAIMVTPAVAMQQLQTPGVYIVEKDAFPNSVVEVATAIPAFIGYTEKAVQEVNDDDKSLLGSPWRITSFSEFETYFGGAPSPKFELKKSEAEEDGTLARPGRAFLTDEGAGEKASLPSARLSVTVDKRPENYDIVQSSTPYTLYAAMRWFFLNGGGDCYIVSVGSYKDEINGGTLTDAITLLEKEREITLLVIPETTRLARGQSGVVQQEMLRHCGERMQNRFAILDIPGGYLDRDPERNSDPISAFRNQIGTSNLSYGATYYPWLNTSVFSDTDMTFENLSNDAREILIDLVRRAAGKENAEYKAIKAIAPPPESGLVSLKEPASAINRALRTASPLYKEVTEKMTEVVNCLPPAAAMAGIYTMVDNTQGVWKAPANVSVYSALQPSVSISPTDQEDLNVTPNGKSINAIRSFIGQGTLVWGARTLDGNSLDWRYINVRRTMSMIEESITLATKAYAFEANDANTWVTIKSMITNYLTGLWKQGGLAGAVPEDAFHVSVGLGETMTPQDILEGILRVSVLVAAVRPAEFIEITFQQQMQTS